MTKVKQGDSGLPFDICIPARFYTARHMLQRLEADCTAFTSQSHQGAPLLVMRWQDRGNFLHA